MCFTVAESVDRRGEDGFSGLAERFLNQPQPPFDYSETGAEGVDEGVVRFLSALLKPSGPLT